MFTSALILIHGPARAFDCSNPNLLYGLCFILRRTRGADRNQKEGNVKTEKAVENKAAKGERGLETPTEQSDKKGRKKKITTGKNI